MNSEYYKPLYLYPDNDDEWWVGLIPGETRGMLYNSIANKTLPVSGWQYANTIGVFHNDPSLTITSGPLPPLCRKFTVTITGAAAKTWPSFLGVFTRTRWWRGRPVFVNSLGMLLHHGPGDYGWMIGRKYGIYTLRGSRSHLSPASERNWKYWTGSDWRSASVTITGSD